MPNVRLEHNGNVCIRISVVCISYPRLDSACPAAQSSCVVYTHAAVARTPCHCHSSLFWVIQPWPNCRFCIVSSVSNFTQQPIPSQAECWMYIYVYLLNMRWLPLELISNSVVSVKLLILQPAKLLSSFHMSFINTSHNSSRMFASRPKSESHSWHLQSSHHSIQSNWNPLLLETLIHSNQTYDDEQPRAFRIASCWLLYWRRNDGCLCLLGIFIQE